MKSMKTMRYKKVLLVAAMAIGIGGAAAQEVVSPCPEVRIEQRPVNIMDHDPDYNQSFIYRNLGWDTAVTCLTHTLELTAEPYIPVQYFNGTYTVEQVPYNPPDTSFSLGTRMPIDIDDVFADNHTVIPYPFYFFGIRKNQFRIGANGLVTFCSPTDFGSGNSCPWAFRSQNQIPWNGTANHTDPFNQARMRDAIYGVMEDTHPGHFVGSPTNRVDGIYYGIQDQFPCRKIICSWKEAPNYGDYDDHGTYQIVCYEGSNIIEVHVKQRRCCPTTSDALIGIQNATGQAQTQGPIGSETYYVVPGSPAAFSPAGRNVFTSNIDTTAYRFTPQGYTMKTYQWYRIFDDGRAEDSVALTTNPNDTNGYYEPMHDDPQLAGYDPEHPTRTKAYVSPTCNSRYVLRLSFKNANNDWYRLYDTITIGYDHQNDMQLKHPAEPDTSRQHDVCQGHNATVSLLIPPTISPKVKTWTVTRLLNGESVILPQTMYNMDAEQMSLTLRPDPQFDTLPRNKIDSIRIQVFCEFTNGCTNFDTFLIRVFPNFDTIEKHGICNGETFTWALNHQTYTQSTTSPKVTLQSSPGCDSVVHLDLTVSSTSLTIDTIVDCKPVLWKGKWYYTSNTATALGDTVVELNQWGCDSVVRLNLSIYPLTAKLSSSVDHFDMNNLDVVLTDISIGGDSRRWIFPTGPEQSSEVAYYTIPANLNEADIFLIAHSPYGCVDTAEIVIPLNKEFFWMPNAFTPDNPAGNTLFGSVSVGTLTQEMYIYNRFGEQIYYCSGVDCTWDGHDVNGRACPQGAYVYIIRYTNIFDPKKTRIVKGAVTLIR